jgi:hypothetical protein
MLMGLECSGTMGFFNVSSFLVEVCQKVKMASIVLSYSTTQQNRGNSTKTSGTFNYLNLYANCFPDNGTKNAYWYLLTQIEYEGFRKRIEYHCSILLGVFQVLLFIFYHRETME